MPLLSPVTTYFPDRLVPPNPSVGWLTPVAVTQTPPSGLPVSLLCHPAGDRAADGQVRADLVLDMACPHQDRRRQARSRRAIEPLRGKIRVTARVELDQIASRREPENRVTVPERHAEVIGSDETGLGIADELAHERSLVFRRPEDPAADRSAELHGGVDPGDDAAQREVDLIGAGVVLGHVTGGAEPRVADVRPAAGQVLDLVRGRRQVRYRVVTVLGDRDAAAEIAAFLHWVGLDAHLARGGAGGQLDRAADCRACDQDGVDPLNDLA